MYIAVGGISTDERNELDEFLSVLAPAPDAKWSEPGYLITTLPDDMASSVKAFLGSRILPDWHSARMMFIKPSGMIHPHSDQAKGTTRFHVVIATNKYCVNFHNGDIQHLAERVIYTVDETVEHASVNWGGTVRAHLVIDARDHVLD